MTDIVRVELTITRSALDLLVACANIGVEGAEGNLADIDDVTDLLDELEPFASTSPNNLLVIDQTVDDREAQRPIVTETHTYQDEQDRANGVDQEGLAH